MITEFTPILDSVEAADSSWWGWAHATPTNTGPFPPLHQLVPTHIALFGSIPTALMAQRLSIEPRHCPCVSEDDPVIVPIDATFPLGTRVNWTTVGRKVSSHADAG